jgi:hypothetical protein
VDEQEIYPCGSENITGMGMRNLNLLIGQSSSCLDDSLPSDCWRLWVATGINNNG